MTAPSNVDRAAAEARALAERLAPRAMRPEIKLPADYQPSLLWSLLSKSPVPHLLVDFPVSPRHPNPEMFARQIAVVPISLEEQMVAQAEAEDFIRTEMLKHPPKEGEKNITYGNLLESERALRVLWRALRDPADEKLDRRAFPGPKMMRMTLTPDQVSILTHQYIRAERLLSPIRDLSTGEELDAFIEKLIEGGKEDPLDWLPSAALRALTWRSIERLGQQARDRSSAGSPPEGIESGTTVDPAPEEERIALVTDQGTTADAPPEPPIVKTPG